MSKLPTKIELGEKWFDTELPDKINSIIDYLSEQGEEKPFDNSVEIAGQTFLKTQSVTADVKIPIAGDGKVPDHLEKNAPHVVVGDGAPTHFGGNSKVGVLTDGASGPGGVTPPHADHAGGTTDELRVYNHALSVQEISDIYTDMAESEWEKEFNKQFSLPLNQSNKNGGYDARSYIKSFISNLLTTTRQEERERVRGIVEGMQNMQERAMTWQEDHKNIYEQALSDILTAIH